MIRTPKVTGAATLTVVLKHRYGGDAGGWVYLKPTGRRASIVGRYELKQSSGTSDVSLQFDVSDEVIGDGRYVVALENT